MSEALRCAAATHAGLVRDNNEDRHHVDREHGVFAVIDGVGGQAAGEVAAETALSLLRARLARRTGTVEERIREGITVANNEIHRLARSNPAYDGMACVLTVAVVEDGTLTAGHVGDTRLYVLENGRIRKLTHDHSPVGEREDRGELSEAEAMRHPRRNEVYRDVGSEVHEPGDPDFIEIVRMPFGPERAILLCSDGLTDLVASDEILSIVERDGGEPERVVQDLVAAANAAGGKDNVTVVYAAGARFGRRRAVAQPAPRARSGSRLQDALTGRWAFFLWGALLGIGMLIGIQAFQQWRQGRPGARSLDAQVVRVGPGGPHATVGEALRRARPGETVLVAPGTYREQLRLVEGVDVVSEVPGAAVLRPSSDPASLGIAVVAEGLRTARLSGFRIEDAPGAPLEIGVAVRDSGLVVEEVEVRGARLAGIHVAGTGEPVVRACTLRDGRGPGIVVRPPAAPRLVHNLVEDTGRSRDAPAPGILLEPGARAVLRGNVVLGSGAEGIRGVEESVREQVLRENLLEAGGRRNGRGPTG